MNREGWIVSLLYVAYFIYELRWIKRDRRSGRVTSNGHPTRDSALLFVSGLILAGVLTIVVFVGNTRLGERDMHFGPIRYAVDLLLLMVAIGLTAFSNRLLGRPHKRRSPNRKEGSAKGEFTVPDDFNRPDPEIEALFYEGDVFPAQKCLR